MQNNEFLAADVMNILWWTNKQFFFLINHWINLIIINVVIIINESVFSICRAWLGI